jgi:hypothetical protein
MSIHAVCCHCLLANTCMPIPCVQTVPFTHSCVDLANVACNILIMAFKDRLGVAVALQEAVAKIGQGKVSKDMQMMLAANPIYTGIVSEGKVTLRQRGVNSRQASDAHSMNDTSPQTALLINYRQVVLEADGCYSP